MSLLGFFVPGVFIKENKPLLKIKKKNFQEVIKGKAFRWQVMKTPTGDGILDFHSYFDIRHNLDGRVVGSTHQPHFNLKEIPWYPFLLEIT